MVTNDFVVTNKNIKKECCINENKKLTIIQEAVLVQIPKGYENPIRSQDIANNIGLSKRDVISIISALVIEISIAIGGSRSEGR